MLVLALAACGSPPAKPSLSTTPSAIAVSPPPSPAPTSTHNPDFPWPQYLGSLARFGVGPASPALDSVKATWSAPLDGLEYAEPLLAQGRVFAATEDDSVYAIDVASGSLAWHVNLGSPMRASQLPCGDIDPSGITSTPAIDPITSTLYAVGFLQPGRHVLFALDLANGSIRWQRTIDPPSLSPLVHQQRGALTIADGRVYVPYGGLYGDCGDYRGWMVASSLDGTGGLLSYEVKAAREAGIWAPGGAVVGPTGDLFVAAGNAEGQGFNYGNSVIRLRPDLTEVDHWAPTNWAALNASDTDVGSITPALLEDGLLFQAGKEGVGYLVNSDHLGGVGGELYSARVCDGLDYGATAYSPPMLYVPCRGIGITALRVSGSSFSIAWKASGGGYTPVVAGGWLWTIGPSQLVQVALDTGAVHATYPLPGVASFATSTPGYGALFVPAGDHLVRFAPG
ncbi:MAG TPA: PQQ-binding-like beta-propeller repeat protein [Candidatus Dormibacteraeota bacterium]|nr:PQQ-binding-like beta-propeller repeat protein [Candidatus Dormibacteraeota bacterium]